MAALKEAVDRVFSEEKWKHTDNVSPPYTAVRLFETDPACEDMLAREPIIGLVESILGPDCHLVAQNVVRNKPGEALDFFHVDDYLAFPVGEGMDRHDPRLTMPVSCEYSQPRESEVLKPLLSSHRSGLTIPSTGQCASLR